MSRTFPETTSRSNYQVIFDSALEAYRKKTGKDLPSDPLFRNLETCHSPDAILAELRSQTRGLGQSQNGGYQSLAWLNPIVNVLNAFSATIGGGVGLAYPPAGVICTGIGILLSAAEAVSTSRDILAGLFERLENIFRRLEVYIEIPRTPAMTDAIVKVMVEVLNILGIATKEVSQHHAKKFLKMLVGRRDIEDALRRLEEVTLEEARMAAAEALKAIHGVGTEVNDTMKAMGDIIRGVEGMLQDVGDRLKGVDDRVRDISGKVISSAEKTGPQLPSDSDAVATGGLTTALGYDNVRRIYDTQGGVYNRAMDVDEVRTTVQDSGARFIDVAEKLSGSMASEFVDLNRDKLKQDSMAWLSPPDPAVNYNIARGNRHAGTTVWFTESSTFKDWKASGSLLWIHGEPGSGKSILTSAVIERISNTEKSVHVTYFFFDFNDSGKQDARALLASILVQLTNQSASFGNMLLELYVAHQLGSKQPSEGDLFKCLEKMLRVPGTVPIYLIIDALDECPGTSGAQSPRTKVLQLLVKMIGFQIPNLRLCIASRPEVDIRNALEPLTSTSNRIPLHDEDGQRKDVDDYVSFVVKTMKWREKDKELAIRALSIRTNRVFCWVSCQIEALRRSLASSVPRVVEKLPETLDETYERILQNIPKANRVEAHRLLECLTVAARPLRVEELAEVLAIDFNGARAIPKLNEDWRWEDQEQAVLTACSTLIAVIDDRNSRVVQISHSSVKDFLTSDRLATAEVDTLRYYHIRPEPAHTVMAQACIAVLLRLEYPVDTERGKRFPLADYAAKHFAGHAEFGNVISHITNGIDDLLDEDKPHFVAWMSHLGSSQLAEIDSGLKTSPLYQLASLGYYGLVHHLILTRPQDKIVGTNVLELSVHAALHQGHVQACQLQTPHCINVDVQNSDGQTPLHVAARHALPDVARMIIGKGADMNARDNNGWTPLQEAAFRGYFDIAQLLLEHGASVHVRNKDGWSPLHEASCYGYLDIVRLLLKHGSDRNATNDNYCTPLHLAASHGQLSVVRLLAEHGANIHVQNKDSWTPLHEATFHDHPDIMRLLLKHGATVHVRNKDGWSPLHEASCYGYLGALRLLLEHGADRNATNDILCTPLHLAAARGQLAAIRLLVEHGANVHAQNRNNWTPLHEATFHGYRDIVRFLLEHGGTVRVQNKDGWTPLHEASCYGYLEIIPLLLEHGADRDAMNDIRNTPLHLAASKGQFAATKLLVEQGVTINMPNKDGWTPLHVATFHGYRDIVRFLLEHGATVQVRNKDGWTLLHEASCYGYIDIIPLLLEHGADRDATNDIRNTPLHLAASKGQFAATKLLVEQGVTINMPNKDGWTPLHVATYHGYRDIVRFLLDHGATLHVQNKDGWTLLHEASCYGYLEIIRLLLDRGANRDAMNDIRNTPLHLAASKGQFAAIKLLVEQGVTINMPNKDGWTPLHVATFHGYRDIVRFLLDHGATVHVQNKDGWTLLHEASCYGYIDIIPLLLDRGANRDAMNDIRNTPLHLAASKGQFAAIKLLVEQGVTINVPNKDGWTPLYEAAFHGHPDIVRFLLEHGASVHIRNKDGWTPLHEASFRGYPDIIQLLLAHGANLEAMDNECSTPLHLAARNGRLAVAQLLVEQGAIVGVLNNGGRTPLHEASFHGHSNITMLLLERIARRT